MENKVLDKKDTNKNAISRKGANKNGIKGNDTSKKLLYLVTDQKACKGKDFFESVKAAIEGGVSLVQLREKDLSTRDFYEKGLKLRDLCTRYRVKLLVNDRIDIALAIGADGVHLGQSDMPIEVAKKILGQDKIIGITAKTLDQAIEAEKNGADYIGVGAFFATPSKQDAVLLNRKELDLILKNISIEKYAIGGIGLDNVDQVMGYDMDGICIISDILGSDDCKTRARQILEKINNEIKF